MAVKFHFDTDEDTKSLLEIAVFFLQRYFSYSEQQAVDLMNQFYEKRRGNNWGDDFYHHEGAYYTAVLMHYSEGLQGDPDKFIMWRLNNGYLQTPGEALEYFREHYVVFRKRWTESSRKP